MAKTLASVDLLASQTLAAGGAAVRSAVLDLRNVDAAELRWAITNSAALGAQCEARVMVACEQGAPPSAAAEGTGFLDWKQRWVQGGGITSGTKTRGAFRPGPEIAYAYIEFFGNTTNSVVIEAQADTATY